MQSAPFWRKMDKFAYVFGTLILIYYSYLLGKYPYTHVFTYHIWLYLFLYAARVIHFGSLRWHMYCIDFCYFANFAIIYYVWYAPKDKNLFIFCYMASNGVLAFSVSAFRNSLVYHKIDYLSSL